MQAEALRYEPQPSSEPEPETLVSWNAYRYTQWITNLHLILLPRLE
jgi:hypothetical protein